MSGVIFIITEQIYIKKTSLLSFLILLFYYNTINSQWENVNSGINDNLNGIVLLDNNGVVVGENGIYYTTNYGNGASNWTRFTITDNASNSTIYENTFFANCSSDVTNTTNSGTIYTVGQNTLDNSAIIFKIDLPSLNYEIIYQGLPNSTLNKLKYRATDGAMYAVGTNGILLKIEGNIVTQINTNMSQDNLKT